MEDKKEFSETIKVVKLLMSSLFARKQPYMIINGHTPGVFYYTNIDHDRVELYRTNVEDVLSKVTVKEQKVLEAFNRAFPVLANAIVQIDLMAFSSGLNQSLRVRKNEYPKIRIDEKSRIVWMTIDPTDASSEIVVDKPVGILLTDLDPEFYDEIIRNFEKFSESMVKRKFRAVESVGDDKVSLDIVEVKNNGDENLEFALPFKDGFSGVSVKEYVRKREGNPIYDLLLRYDPIRRTSKAAILYGDDWLDAMTIMPGSLWFMTRLGM